MFHLFLTCAETLSTGWIHIYYAVAHLSTSIWSTASTPLNMLFFFALLSPACLCSAVVELVRREGAVKHFSSFLIVLTCAIGIPIRPHWFHTAKCIDFDISHWSQAFEAIHTCCVTASFSHHYKPTACMCVCVCLFIFVLSYSTSKVRTF